ncbi:CysS/YqeB C-terminal domain-containing protein [Streptomyces sp. NRRL S-1813]|uniref:CysS/YqeB C-terminal domain-containing protein n=1 Tax=Streptomyces sp. NRRL S-1813 TaxID=1463888 RepID=UPI003B63A12A
MPDAANAFLKARQGALEKKGPSDDDTRELRAELARLGVVVRDEKGRQYWRTCGS